MPKKLKINTSGRTDISKECFGKNIRPHIIGASYWNEEEDEEKKEEKKKQVKPIDRSFSTPLPAPGAYLEKPCEVANTRLQGRSMNIGKISGFDKI